MTEITLTQTCDACPEQYDAYIGDERVAYLRLRHGHFTVQCPPGGEVIYEAYPNGDGCFYAAEREHYLSEARLAMAAHLGTTCPEYASLETTATTLLESLKHMVAAVEQAQNLRNWQGDAALMRCTEEAKQVIAKAEGRDV